MADRSRKPGSEDRRARDRKETGEGSMSNKEKVEGAPQARADIGVDEERKRRMQRGMDEAEPPRH